MLHLFEHGQRLRVVDMPGYGFSKTAPATRDGWDALMMTFFESRAEAAAAGDASVLQTFVLVDCRRGLLDMDMHMLDLLASFGLERTVVLTKADKLHRKQLDAVVHGTAMALASTGHLEIRAEEILAAENGAEGYRYDSNGREASGEGGGLILTSTKTNLGVGQLRARVMAPA
jgi:GTP-binding protein EngB required for normal cell division